MRRASELRKHAIFAINNDLLAWRRLRRHERTAKAHRLQHGPGKNEGTRQINMTGRCPQNFLVIEAIAMTDKMDMRLIKTFFLLNLKI